MPKKRRVSWVYAEWESQVLQDEPHDPEEKMRLREALFSKCFQDRTWLVSVEDASLVAGLFLSGAPLGSWSNRAIEVGELYFQHADIDKEDRCSYVSLSLWLGLRYLVKGDSTSALVHFQKALDKEPKQARLEIWRGVPSYLSLLGPDAPADPPLVDFLNRMLADWPSKEKKKIKITPGASNADVIRALDESEHQHWIEAAPIDRELHLLNAIDCPADQKLKALLEILQVQSHGMGSYLLSEAHLLLQQPQEARRVIEENFEKKAEEEEGMWTTLMTRRAACLLATGESGRAAEVITEVFTSAKGHYVSWPLYRELKLIRPLLDWAAPIGADLANAFEHMLRDWSSESVQQTKLTGASSFEDLMYALDAPYRESREQLMIGPPPQG